MARTKAVAIFRSAALLLFLPRWRRKSFEYEDAARLTVKDDPSGGEAGDSGLYHAYSDDNIYEDIVCKSKHFHFDFWH